MRSVGEIAKDALVDIILANGSKVSQEVYEKRREMCEKCEHFGTVRLLVYDFDGCTICGCPIETKGRMADLHGKKITCPHPEGDKWDFSNIKNTENE